MGVIVECCVIFYLVIGLFFSYFMLLWTQEKYKYKTKDMNIVKMIGVALIANFIIVTFLWPFIFIIYIFLENKKH